ncbi:hypothetical protein M885DRAFT_514656 [Pelagophyceae sp. CCMP2097]|nr:hypothetical protein M885DRAFT_514656 [Pelagophyceae sp. CCMP2097]
MSNSRARTPDSRGGRPRGRATPPSSSENEGSPLKGRIGSKHGFGDRSDDGGNDSQEGLELGRVAEPDPVARDPSKLRAERQDEKRGFADELEAEAEKHARQVAERGAQDSSGDDEPDDPERRRLNEGTVEAGLVEARQNAAAAAPARRRRERALGRDDVAALGCVFLVGGCTMAFELLCLVDGQCTSRHRHGDPALDELAVAVAPALAVAAAVVAPALLAAADAARRLVAAGDGSVTGDGDARRVRRDRAGVRCGLAAAAALCVLMAALVAERSIKLQRNDFRRNADNKFRRCDAAADGDTVWRDAGDCPYGNAVRVHYNDKARNLAQKRERNLRHVIYVSAALCADFFLVAVALGLSLSKVSIGGAGFGGGFDTDMLRRRPRLVERRR